MRRNASRIVRLLCSEAKAPVVKPESGVRVHVEGDEAVKNNLREVLKPSSEPIPEIGLNETNSKGYSVWMLCGASALVASSTTGVFAYRLGKKETGEIAAKKIRALRTKLSNREEEYKKMRARAVVAETRLSALDPTFDKILEEGQKTKKTKSLQDWLLGN